MRKFLKFFGLALLGESKPWPTFNLQRLRVIASEMRSEGNEPDPSTLAAVTATMKVMGVDVKVIEEGTEAVEAYAAIVKEAQDLIPSTKDRARRCIIDLREQIESIERRAVVDVASFETVARNASSDAAEVQGILDLLPQPTIDNTE
jgi:hypothetical protein